MVKEEMKRDKNADSRASTSGQETIDQKVELFLANVHCADCVRDLVENTILKLDGVKDATFDQPTLCLTVFFDSKLIAEEEIREAVLNLGYKFKLPSERTTKKILKEKRYNLVIIAVVVVVIIVLVWLVNRL